MASRADVERFAQAARDVRTLALRELEQMWQSVDVTDAVAARNAVEEFLPLLVERHGEIAATVAADWYDDLRDQAGMSGRFSAVLADPPEAEAVRANGRWAVGPVFRATPDAFQAGRRLAQSLERMALQSGRDTVALSVERDPASARYARVPQGAETCAFCLMLASRGAVYRSKSTADGGRYHADCDCVPTPFWEGQPYPDNYDPDALYEKYDAAAEEVHGAGATTKDILSEIRRQQGIH